MGSDQFYPEMTFFLKIASGQSFLPEWTNWNFRFKA